MLATNANNYFLALLWWIAILVSLAYAGAVSPCPDDPVSCREPPHFPPPPAMSCLFSHNSCRACYGELGCMSSGGHFHDLHRRPVSTLPARREDVDTRFYLYTRSNPCSGDWDELSAGSDRALTINNSNFDASRPAGTAFIIHGIQTGSCMFQPTFWMQQLKAAMLEYGDYNVILVDWARSNRLPYHNAAANTRVVGAEVALLVNHLISEHGLTAAQVHILGHSLGAHAAGYAGERIDDLGRITAMDPAGLDFAYTHTSVRLDPTDAVFVDVVHTTSSDRILHSILHLEFGLGTLQPQGHRDFYPNGAERQPGCKRHSLIHRTTGLDCNHLRSISLVVDSFRFPSKYVAYPCKSYEDFKRGECIGCASSACTAHLGILADSSPDSNSGSYYLRTDGKSPYFLYHYQVKIQLSDQGHYHYGSVYINMSDSVGASTGYLQVTSGHGTELWPGRTSFHLLTTSVHLADVEAVGLKWYCKLRLHVHLSLCMSHPAITVDRITITRGHDQQAWAYCAGHEAVSSHDGNILLTTLC